MALIIWLFIIAIVAMIVVYLLANAGKKKPSGPIMDKGKTSAPLQEKETPILPPKEKQDSSQPF